MAASETQLLVISNGEGYVWNFSTLVFAQITDADFPADAVDCEFSDGYFIVLADNTIYLSANNDATSWDALDFLTVASSANNLVANHIDHRQLIAFGDRITQVFNNTGAESVYEADGQGIIQMGLAARHSVVRLDNTTYFLGENENGRGMIFKLDGYLPARVSDHALEQAIQRYTTISDAVAYGFQWQGHHFYRITFPTPNKTWQLDVNTGKWTEITYLNNGSEQAHLGLVYAYAFGKHIVGSRLNNQLYEFSATTYADAGDAIQRIRRTSRIGNRVFEVLCTDPVFWAFVTAHLWVREGLDGKRTFFDRLELVMQTGIGLSVAEGALGHTPLVQLRWSDDGGQTWSSYMTSSAGAQGQYRTKVFWTRLGSVEN